MWKGSDKAFNFCYRARAKGFLFLKPPLTCYLSLCLFKKAWQKQSYLSLGGVGEKALLRFLSDRPNIRPFTSALTATKPERRLQPPCGACAGGLDRPPPCAASQGLERGIAAPGGNHRREVYPGSGLRLERAAAEETVEIIRMSEVDTRPLNGYGSRISPLGK